MNIEVIKYENDNATTISMIYQNFGKFQKMKNFKIFLKIDIFLNFFCEKHSTSPPCGNLVDGLPHDCHTKTVAKPGRLEPAKNDDTPP